MKPPLVLLAILFLFSCSDKKTEVEKEMKAYGQWILHGRYDSMANKFTAHGELAGEGVHSVFGRDSIAALLKNLGGATVIKYETNSKKVEVYGDDVIQEGSYMQIVSVPSGDTLELAGDFITTWNKSEGEWLIRKLSTMHYRNLKEERENKDPAL